MLLINEEYVVVVISCTYFNKCLKISLILSFQFCALCSIEELDIRWALKSLQLLRNKNNIKESITFSPLNHPLNIRNLFTGVN